LLRTISTRQLLGFCAGVVGLLIGGAALALATTGGGPKPPPESLPVAVHDALTAPPPGGVSGRIQFTDHLINNSDVRGGSPLLSGASGRFWASPDGHLRIELQADPSAEGATSDTQLLSDGHQVSVYDSGTNTVYEATLPQGHDRNGPDASTQEQGPSLDQVKKCIARLMEHALVGGAEPSDVAGQPAYTVRVEPKQSGGLVGGAELAWDAVRGTPLRAAVYARGDSSPVVELKVTDISYGSVPSSVFQITPPGDAKVVDLSPSGHGSATGPDSSANGETPPVTGLDQVQQSLSFPVTAPDTVAGLARNEVRLVQGGKDAGALVTYGHGLGGIAVLERPVEQGSSSTASGGGQSQLTLPTVSIEGVQAEELATPLGTALRFQRAGVDYTVLGSVPTATAEAAARDLH
jgi:outer membrane lipoprotein-sorting protein